MPRTIVKPDDVDFVSPGRRDYWVAFEHPTLWGNYVTPVTVLVGPDADAGRGLVAIGSNHGNEYEGPVALKHLLHDYQLNAVRGRIILIPVLNSAAFAAGTRDTPDDGANLNRAFPGNATGSITQRYADFVYRLLFPHVHIVIDIHAGGLVSRFPMTTSYHHVADPAQQAAMEETARDFGAPFVMIYQDNTPGLLPSAAERLGKITIGAEFGWGEAVNPDGVAMAKQGVTIAAIKHGLLNRDQPPNQHCPYDQQQLVDGSGDACSISAPFTGHFEPTVARGSIVSAGQTIAYMHDFDRIDTPPVAILSPHNGCVIAQAWGARVQIGQTISVVGQVRPWLCSTH